MFLWTGWPSPSIVTLNESIFIVAVPVKISFHSCSDPDMPSIITEALEDMVVIKGTDMSSNWGKRPFSSTNVMYNNEEGLKQYGHAITAAQWCGHHRKVRTQL